MSSCDLHTQTCIHCVLDHMDLIDGPCVVCTHDILMANVPSLGPLTNVCTMPVLKWTCQWWAEGGHVTTIHLLGYIYMHLYLSLFYYWPLLYKALVNGHSITQ